MAEETTSKVLRGFDEMIDSRNELTVGTPEHRNATAAIVDTQNAALNEQKLMYEIGEKQARLDYEYERMREDMACRRYEAEVEERKSKRDFISKVLGIGSLVTLTIGTFIYEGHDNIMPRDKLKYIDKIKFW